LEADAPFTVAHNVWIVLSYSYIVIVKPAETIMRMEYKITVAR
jgi:hypothetical protein